MKHMGELVVVKVNRKRLRNKKHCKHKGLDYYAQPISIIIFGYLGNRGIWTSVIERATFNPKTKLTTIYARNNKCYTVDTWKGARNV